jgi:hypothetical protein
MEHLQEHLHLDRSRKIHHQRELLLPLHPKHPFRATQLIWSRRTKSSTVSLIATTSRQTRPPQLPRLHLPLHRCLLQIQTTASTMTIQSFHPWTQTTTFPRESGQPTLGKRHMKSQPLTPYRPLPFLLDYNQPTSPSSAPASPIPYASTSGRRFVSWPSSKPILLSPYLASPTKPSLSLLQAKQ